MSAQRSPAVKLKFQGKAFDPNPPSPALVKLMKFLDGCPVDEIFTVEQVAQKTGSSKSWLKELLRSELMADYSHTVGIKYVGNPKAIAELRRQVGA